MAMEMSESDNLYFATQFWNDDEQSQQMTQGFERLMAHAENGRNSMACLQMFLREFSRVQLGHSKNVLTIAKKLVNVKVKEAYPRLADAVQETAHFTEEISKLHEAIGTELATAGDELSQRHKSLVKGAKEKTTKMKTFSRERDNAVKAAQDKNAACEKRKTEKSEAIQAQSQIDGGILPSATFSLKLPNFKKGESAENLHPQVDQEKKEAAMAKAKIKTQEASRALNDSQEALSEAVRNVETKQEQWNNEYEQTCLELQKEEEIRYAEMTKKLKLVLTKHLDFCMNTKKLGDEVRQKLQDSDVSEDLKDFIKDNRTGSVRVKNPGGVVAGCREETRRGSRNWGGGLGGAGGGGGGGGGGARAEAFNPSDDFYGYDNEEGTKTQDESLIVGSVVRALDSFTSRGNDELSFKVNEEAKVISVEDEWYFVDMRGRRGYVPANFFGVSAS